MLILGSLSFIESLCCHWLLHCLDENMYTLSSLSQSPIEKLIIEYKDPSKKGGSSVFQSSPGGHILARFHLWIPLRNPVSYFYWQQKNLSSQILFIFICIPYLLLKLWFGILFSISHPGLKLRRFVTVLFFFFFL